MNRREKLNFIYKEILPTAEIPNDYWLTYGYQVIAEILNGITKWRIGKNPDIEMKASVIDGCLFINNDFVCRVAPSQRKAFDFTDKEYFYEGKCLYDGYDD